MKPSHPGSFIRTEILEPLGLSVTRAAEILDVRRATLFELLNGSAGLSPEMALRLEKAFGVNLDMMLRMQAWYDAAEVRQSLGDQRPAVRAGFLDLYRASQGFRLRLGGGMEPAFLSSDTTQSSTEMSCCSAFSSTSLLSDIPGRRSIELAARAMPNT